jgi:uncharacterized protein (TIGR03437 family)
VANGKVYGATQNSLAVYGLLTSGSAPIALSNAASGVAAALAPGALVAVYGTGLATSTVSAASLPLPTTLGGAVVNIGGIAAPITYASPTQINIQIPFQVPTGSSTVNVTVNGTPAGSTSVSVNAIAPGLFLLQSAAAVVNQNGSVNSQSQPAAAGSIVAAFLTGLGAVNPSVATGAAAPASPLSLVSATVTATIGNVSAPVQFAGLAPGFAGLYQVNIQVPQMAAGQYMLQVSAGAALSNSASIYVQ